MESTKQLTVSLENALLVAESTGNVHTALRILSGIYKAPAYSEQAIIKDKIMIAYGFNAMDNKVLYKYPEFKYYNDDKSDYSFKPTDEKCNAVFYRFVYESIDHDTWEYYAQMLKDQYALAEEVYNNM